MLVFISGDKILFKRGDTFFGPLKLKPIIVDDTMFTLSAYGDSKKESTNGTWIFILNPVKITDNFMFKAEHTLFIASLTNNK